MADSKDTRILKYPVRFYLGAICTAIWNYTILMFCIENFTDFNKAVGGISELVQLNLVVVKGIYFCFRIRDFLKINAVSEYYAKQASIDEIEIWNTGARFCRAGTTIYVILIIVGSSFACLVPFIRMLYVYIRYDELIFTLPLMASFPFDIAEPDKYLFVWLTFSQFLLFLPSLLVGTDSAFAWVVFSISAHMRILRSKLQKLLTNTDSYSHLKLAHLIFYHCQILKLVEQFDGIFVFIVFVEVLLSCVQLCFLSYCVGFATSPENMPLFLVFIVVVVLQMIILCFGGQEVKNENELFSQQIYLLNQWHLLSPEARRNFLMPLVRSQRPLALSGYFFDADRNLLIFRTTGSFIALLFALVSKDN